MLFFEIVIFSKLRFKLRYDYSGRFPLSKGIPVRQQNCYVLQHFSRIFSINLMNLIITLHNKLVIICGFN